MDPWQPCQAIHTNQITAINVDGLALHNGDENHEQENFFQATFENSSEDQLQSTTDSCGLSFGDNFQPFVKLPDSQEYLDSLENKLKSIKKGGRKGPTADAILRSLEQTKESCMIKLLSSSVEQLTTEGEFFEELKVNPVLKKLAPERQALSTEELVHLIKADQLDIILNNNHEEEAEAVSQPTTEQESAAVVETETDQKDIIETSASQSDEL